MSNKEIETLIRKEGVFKWQIARVLQIHEGTFSRWFRDPLTEEQVRAIVAAIEQIKLDKLKSKG